MQHLYKMRYPDTDQLDVTAEPKPPPEDPAADMAAGTQLRRHGGGGQNRGSQKTALMIACRKGLLTSVEYLLEVLSLLFLCVSPFLFFLSSHDAARC